MIVPVRKRPRSDEVYPCPRCGRLISPVDHLCLHCTDTGLQRRKEFVKRQSEGGRPFFIIAGVLGILLVLYLLLAL